MDRHKWTERDLAIAYYFTVYGKAPLGMPLDIVCVLMDVSVRSFQMQSANFRILLNSQRPGAKLTHFSKAMVEITKKYSDVQILKVGNDIVRGLRDQSLLNS